MDTSPTLDTTTTNKRDVLFDMETGKDITSTHSKLWFIKPFTENISLGDPDDCITLLLLMHHSKVNLRAVTIYPGNVTNTKFM